MDYFRNRWALYGNAFLIVTSTRRIFIMLSFLLGGFTCIPKVQAMIQESFNDIEPTKSVNLDKAVVFGAVVQAAGLPGRSSSQVQDHLLLDVTPLSMGLQQEVL